MSYVYTLIIDSVCLNNFVANLFKLSVRCTENAFSRAESIILTILQVIKIH